jgi:hypothetical protein
MPSKNHVKNDTIAFLRRRRRGDPKMEITDEEFMADETEQAGDEVLREAWPVVPSDETLEEFIGYLMDLDLRF